MPAAAHSYAGHAGLHSVPQPEVSPSAQTPRTRGVVGSGKRFGEDLKRYLAAVIAFGGAAGVTMAQLIQGGKAVRQWVEGVGLWPALGLFAIGLFALHVVHTRKLLKETLEAVERRGDRQVEILERQVERDHALFQETIERLMRGLHDEAQAQVQAMDTLSREIGEMKARLDDATGPRRRTPLGT